MYTNIYVALDNSEHSDTASTVALALASAFDANVIGMHVYAARMHDYRFKQMEYTLPEEYQDEAELLRQRRIHDSLITTGLELISDSYTDVLRFRCLERGVPFTARMRDGRNWEEIVADIDESQDVDVVVMGALGTGAVKESQLGSVTERVARRIRRDLLIIRTTGESAMEGGILVAIDGSPQSFAGLRTALALGRALDKRVEAVAVYDPYLHYAVFNGIVDVLSEKASKVFRFKEQEALHEEIIDTGLAKIYESHLRVARATAAEEGVDLPITLLDGKAFERVLRHARETKPWLLVLGRIGVHSDAAMDMGSNTEQLLRLAPCNVLVSSGSFTPPIDVRADASVVWTPEAEDRMAAVPAGARGLARTAVLRWAMERGHSVVSSGDVATALDELMPFARVQRRIAETAATVRGAEDAMLAEPALEDARAVCRTCGYAARSETPQRCPVCGGGAGGFERLDSDALRAAAAGEGDAARVAFDGAKLGWTVEARRLLQQLPAGYLRRRVKAIVEKQARTRRLPAITAEVAEPFVTPELAALDGNAGPHRAPLGVERHTGPAVDQRRRLPWTDEADDRIERIPAGFLRNLATEQIERLAVALGAPQVGLLHVEAGIAEARARMQRTAAPTDGTCPVGAEPVETAVGCPVHPAGPGPAPTSRGSGLNEITAPVIDDLGRRVTAATPDS
jgi:nucleotide-binding universal stress UspA family protein/predicted Zn-ribbon and HTH transcriptional regulator